MIVPIVEGQAEVESVPELLRRFCGESQAYEVRIAPPIRVKRYKVVKEGELERTIDLARRLYPELQAILVLLDDDDDCPKQVGPQILGRAELAAGGDVVCSIILPKFEFEAWFLASIESLRGQRGVSQDALAPPEPESIRDAKGWLTGIMTPGRSYVETDDQPAFASRFDFQQASARSRSFRKFQKDVRHMIARLTSGTEPG